MPQSKRVYAQVMERLAELNTQFAQNVLGDESNYRLVLSDEADLAGLPDFVRASAAQAATERGLAGQYVITLSRSHIVPFLTFSEAPRSARAGLACLGGPRRSGGGDRQPRHRPRDPDAA